MHFFKEFLAVLKWSCFSGVTISWYIFIKIFRIRKRSNIINNMSLLHLFITSVLVPVRIFTFFHIGYSHFHIHQTNPKENIQVCKLYIITSGINLGFSIFMNLGIVFCRFIYARYATGLLSMGSNLFHSLLCIVVGAFILHGLLQFPIRNLFLLEDADLNNIQKRICTKTPITWFKDEEQNRKFSLKPKILQLAYSTIFLIWNCFFYVSAQRQVDKYRIPKTRINLMTMKHQSQYLTILILVLAFDQLLFIFFQMFYEELGVEKAFTIWWISHLFEIVLIHISLPVRMYINAIMNFEEFNGYKPKQYPGQEKPRQGVIRPRRPNHSIRRQVKPAEDSNAKSARKSWHSHLSVKIAVMAEVHAISMPPITD